MRTFRLLDGIHPLANLSLSLQARGDEGYLRLQVIALDYKPSILVQVTIQFVQQIRDLVDNVGRKWRDVRHGWQRAMWCWFKFHRRKAIVPSPTTL